MYQNGFIFNTTQVPRPGVDKIKTYFKPGNQTFLSIRFVSSLAHCNEAGRQQENNWTKINLNFSNSIYIDFSVESFEYFIDFYIPK